MRATGCRIALVLLALCALAPRPAAADDTRELALRLLGEMRGKPDPLGKRKQAAQSQLLDCGEAVVPALIGLLEEGAPIDRVAAIEILALVAIVSPDVEAATPTLIGLLQDEDRNLRLTATAVLLRNGEEIRDAVPVLIELVRRDPDDEAIRHWSWLVVSKVGPPAVPALGSVVNDANEKVAYWSMISLGRMLEGARPAVPYLLQALTDPRDGVRKLAGETLLMIGLRPEDGQQALGVLVGGLDDPFPVVRRQSANLLAMLGPSALPAVKDLKKAMTDGDEEVMSAAAKAIQRIADQVYK